MSARRSKKQRFRLPRAGVRHTLRLPILRRRRWTNHTGNQGVDPVALIVEAESADDLAAAVLEAQENGLTARAVGSGHSWSDVALSTGFLITPNKLTGVHPPDAALLKAGTDTSNIFSVRSGTTLRQLNSFLQAHDRALIQMGGYDGQTLAGAVSTSTHGSGIAFGPLPDFMRSIDLVDGVGRLRRIEPKEGPTDPNSFKQERPGWLLEQDDVWFDAVRCGMGCMGLIVELMIEVRNSFELTEVRETKQWSEVKADLQEGVVGRYQHYEVLVNPYARSGPGSNLCLVTTREEGNRGGVRHRPRIPELLANLPWITSAVMQFAGEFAPGAIPWLLDTSLKAIRSSGYTNVSYKVFNIGSANNLYAYSAEMAVPVEGEKHIDAVEIVLDTAARYAREGKIYHTAPMSLRFVAASRALMSMMYGRPTMMIELIQLVDTDGGMEILAAHEENLAAVDVRPHWGQVNTLSPEELAGMYPRQPDWEAVRKELDPKDVFASPFTKRVGITARGVVPGPARLGAPSPPPR